jgi:molybdopterin converting factor small subunit
MGYVVTVRYFAAARAATGLTEERTESQTLADLVSRLSADHGEGLAKVLTVASFLVDGVAWHDREAALPAGATVDVLPPFAGG